MADIMWAGKWRVDEQVARLVDTAADRAGIPRNALRAHVIAESYLPNMRRVHPAAIGDNGLSVGLLQLYDGPGGGQGSGMTKAERSDPRRNLEVGVPHIAAAWKSLSALTGRQRVERTAALSGHPRDPDQINERAVRDQVQRSIGRIGDIWAELEGAAPDVPATAGPSVGPVSVEGVQRVTDELGALLREHKAAVAAIGGAALIVLLG